MHRVCCCGGCPQSCCDLWSCSPAGPINITLSGTSETYDLCDNGFDYVHEEVTWEITATLTRSGRNCNAYYFSTNTANLEITYKARIWAETTGAVCDAPPAPCQFDHCDDCVCHPPSREVCKLTTWTYNGPIAGSGPAFIVDPRYAALVPANAVLTIACAANQCDSPCVNPILLWTPADSCEESSCPNGCKDFTKTVTCGTIACCDTDPECGLTQPEAVCLDPFILIGRGCLNADTFNDPRAVPYNAIGAPPTTGDPNPLHPLGGFPLSAAYGYCYGNPASPPPGGQLDPFTCGPFNFAAKNCDYCWYDPQDVIRTCYQLDPANPSNVIALCTPAPPCCSTRARQAITWNLS